MEEPIRVSSGSNELFGMLHTPDEGPIRAAILIANSRVEYRAGPHRFYVRAAHRWAERGFAVLRLDHPGNGDSPGDEDDPHMDSFPIEPLVDAVEFLRAKSDAPNVVLAGLCMGARNALYGAARSPSVHHLLAFGRETRLQWYMVVQMPEDVAASLYTTPAPLQRESRRPAGVLISDASVGRQ